ncbi:hypothetical protein [Xanthobacter sp. KR7-225]|uniref:hypothetical protein n=1 Tax=Xanthobacter sp. KR7-225 TaxID=3156613 RepID=UPI0032B412F2
MALASTLLLLAACAASVEPPRPPEPELPPAPAEIVACLHMQGVEIPERAISDGEAEKLWGDDRRIGAALGRCGRRFVAWYEQLRTEWR